MNNSLPPECILRPANASDIWAIARLVLSAKLDPTQIRWQQFWLIECEGKIVACGQLRAFEGAQELGSLVVAKNWRDRSLGSYLAGHLIRQATQPLYLECLGERLVKFYTNLGFVPVDWKELPRSLWWKFGITQLGAKIVPFITVTIMKYSSGEMMRSHYK